MPCALGLRFETGDGGGLGGVLALALHRWAHESGDKVQEVGMAFAEAPSGISFGVIFAETPRDSALVDADASFMIGNSAERGSTTPAASKPSTTRR